jgi:hypothetical protein
MKGGAGAAYLLGNPTSPPRDTKARPRTDLGARQEAQRVLPRVSDVAWDRLSVPE